MASMTSAEHSRLLYLLDALRGAPEKASRFLTMADKGETASLAYRDVLARLGRATRDGALASAIIAIRQELL